MSGNRFKLQEPKASINFNAPISLLTRIDAIAVARSVSRNSLLVEAMELRLAQEAARGKVKINRQTELELEAAE